MSRDEVKKKRAPFQVLVLPYRKRARCYEFAIFRRGDAGYWQGVAGGGDEGERVLAAAKRETYEEAGIPATARYYALTTTAFVPTFNFKARAYWPRDLYVIPEYAFSVDASKVEIALSAEHTRFAWLPFDQASQKLHWQTNRVALWELHERLRDGTLKRAR